MADHCCGLAGASLGTGKCGCDLFYSTGVEGEGNMVFILNSVEVCWRMGKVMRKTVIICCKGSRQCNLQ